MATSLKRGLLTKSHAKEVTEVEESVEEDVQDPSHNLKSHIKTKISKVKPTIKLHERHAGFSHLAKVLTVGERNDALNAVDQLKGRSRVLYELASFSKHPYVRLAAITYLSTDTEALREIAKYCHHSDTRAAALDEMANNADSLVEVACSSNFKESRIDAVLLLANTKSLVHVALRSPSSDSRNAALEKLSFDQGALERIVEEGAYRKTRVEALKKLSVNVSALLNLIVRSRHLDVKRHIADLLAAQVEHIDDVHVLVEMAKNCANQDSRYLAVGKLWKYPEALKRVAKETGYKDAKTTALMLLSDMVENLEDSTALVEIANTSPYEDCRSAAIEKLVGISSALLSIASKSKFRDAREMALKKLSKDAETLKDVLKMSKYKDTRNQAFKMVSEPQIFQQQLTRILG